MSETKERNADINAKRLERYDVKPKEGQPPRYPVPVPFVRRMDIPPRERIYRWIYYRGYITMTAGHGGVGKSSIVDLEIVSMALGIDLLQPSRPTILHGPCKVLVLSLEDDRDEHDRRMEAIIRHYRLNDDEVAALERNVSRIFDRDGKITVARYDGALEINEEAVAYIVQAVRQFGADVVIVDPFVSIHACNENDNTQMAAVGRILRSIAGETHAAVHIVHHSSKAADAKSADAMRGASSLKNLGRAVRMVTRLSDADIKALGIGKEEARYLIMETNAKANFTPPDEATYFETVGVPLDNATERYPSDTVAVAVRWYPRFALDGVPTAKVQEVWAKIATLEPMKRRKDPRADGWLGRFIAKEFGFDLDDEEGANKVKQIIKKWVKNGKLRVVKEPDEKSRPRDIYELEKDNV